MTIPKLAATSVPAADRDPHRGREMRALRRVIERALRTVSYVACVLVIIGFVAFAYDQIWIVSEHARTEIANSEVPDPTPAGERARERGHTKAREVIDDANDVLLKPFAGIDTTTQPWLRRLVPALLALLVYGFGLGYLASFARGRFPR
jgi:H+/Cl- antiporter ClcA